ncbi:hypothetical protein GCM10027280_08110 [Micromonospora polyrhachis]|uniref:Uncharacterized protein n=1 Tax=Micromonospora polyrhachis TaxID=1282883 RepID=A0A7W7SP15_9ACTN|nr:phosphatidylserine/phosphatidylglycerophosphate/cardiolipin synthase family protein [Micromonospora polyrhachis]MBB4958328.1 hypothetical protein [Micromonospora polyrhachis]
MQIGRSEEQPPAKAHRRLIAKILISLAGFLVTFSISTFLPLGNRSDLLWSLGVSLFVAAVVFIAQYLFEVEKRLYALEQRFDEYQQRTQTELARHAEATERHLSEGFSKIHLATELFGLVEASQLKPGEMAQLTKLVRSRTKITSATSPLVQEFAQTEITRLAEYLKQIGDGSDLTYEGEDRDWILGLTKAAKSSIKATSLSTVDAGGRSFVDGGVWQTDLGQRYLALQRQAIKRGVRVQRIFIIDRDELPAKDLDQVLQLHYSIGVEVRTLDNTAAAAFHSRLRDFILFDEVLSYQSTAATTLRQLNPIIVNTSLVTDPERVNKRILEFADLWNAEDAREFRP